MTVSSPLSAARLRTLGLLTLLILISTTLGCAFGEIRLGDPFDRQLTFDESQRRYTVLVRFSEFQKAKDFVAEDHRADFLATMKSLEDARFTDFESESVELDDEKQSATVQVTYTIYTPSLPYEVEVGEQQVWSRDGISNHWKVVSTFEGLSQFASN